MATPWNKARHIQKPLSGNMLVVMPRDEKPEIRAVGLLL
jgi:hypothetical protein